MYKYTVQSFPQYRATVSVVDSAHGNDKEKYLTNITRRNEKGRNKGENMTINDKRSSVLYLGARRSF